MHQEFRAKNIPIHLLHEEYVSLNFKLLSNVFVNLSFYKFSADRQDISLQVICSCIISSFVFILISLNCLANFKKTFLKVHIL